MRLVRDYNAKDLAPNGSAVTIGNFDGLHQGHQALIGQARECAGNDLSTVVVSFDPLASEFFAPGRAPARIYNASERLRLLQSMDIDLVWLLRFNAQMAATEAEDFIAQMLVGALNAKFIVVGDDFRFGNNRRGDVEMLERVSAAQGFEVIRASTLRVDETRVSSTVIRSGLEQGDFVQVERMLGRPYRMYGRVVRGKQLGRKLGYPTANIRLHRVKSPLHGIYAVRTYGAGLRSHPAVASIGSRPVVNGVEFLLEVHLFDFDGDLYGQHLDVEFVGKLRDEQDFADLDALIAQMDIDSNQARQLLAAHE